MRSFKRVLLIAGGGTLGTYVSKELLSKGCFVDVLSVQAEIIEDERFTFHEGSATKDNLASLFEKNKYDAIINFMHYTDVEEYKATHKMLIENTDHLVFLSSYRVYADSSQPLTENADRLIDVIEDDEFLSKEDYAVPKAKCEDFLKRECAGQPWTIVRPVISFSDKRFDLYTYSGQDILQYIKSGEEILLPELARGLTAGIDWAGNTGKLIANLLFKPETFGETYTVSSGQNLTWEEVSQCYSEICGLNISWTDEDSFIKAYPCVQDSKKWLYLHDRKYNRCIDNSKILAASGLKKEDFLDIKTALKIELSKAGYVS